MGAVCKTIGGEGGGRTEAIQYRIRSRRAEGGGGCTQFVHGRSRMAIRPSHPYYAGTEHVGFSPTRQTLLAPSAKRRAVLGREVMQILHFAPGNIIYLNMIYRDPADDAYTA